MFVYLCVPWHEEKIGLQVVGCELVQETPPSLELVGKWWATVRNAKAHGHSTLVPCTSLHSPLNALFGI